MNKAEELNSKVLEEINNYKTEDIGPWARKIDKSTDFYKEMTNSGKNCLFYQWLACLVRITKPQVVVELGADRGGSAVVILSELPETGRLYSVDVRQGWEYIPTWDRRILQINSDDLEPNVYNIIPS